MNDFLQLAREYLEAAELLYDRGARSRPVSFCYIQSAELLLKGWLQQQSSLSESLRKTHDLIVLWDSLSESESSPDDRHLVETLNPIDPKTTRFRYPTNHVGDWNLDDIRNAVRSLHQLPDR